MQKFFRRINGQKKTSDATFIIADTKFHPIFIRLIWIQLWHWVLTLIEDFNQLKFNNLRWPISFPKNFFSMEFQRKNGFMWKRVLLQIICMENELVKRKYNKRTPFIITGIYPNEKTGINLYEKRYPYEKMPNYFFFRSLCKFSGWKKNLHFFLDENSICFASIDIGKTIVFFNCLKFGRNKSHLFFIFPMIWVLLSRSHFSED